MADVALTFDDLPAAAPPGPAQPSGPGAPAQAQPQQAGPQQQPVADPPYPVQGGGSLTPEQNSMAWSLYKTGGIKPGGQGTANSPYIVQPGRPVPAGSYIIDQAGHYGPVGDDGMTVHGADSGVLKFDDLPTPGQDLGRSIVGAAEHWAPDLVGSIGNMRQGVGAIADWGDNAFLHAVGMLPKDQESHVASAMLAPTPGNVGTNPLFELAPTTAQLDAPQQAAYGKYYAPQTEAGKLAASVTRFAPNALFGEGEVLPRLLSVAGSGVGSELAGEAGDAYLQPQYSWIPRAAGAVAGGGGTSLLTAPDKASSVLASTAKGVTPEHLVAAQDLRATAEGLGVPLTTPESLQAVSGNAYPGMAQLQQRVEGSANGGPVMQPMMTARPAAAHAALTDALAKVSPPTDQPSMVGANAQAAAQGVIGGLKGERTALVNPYYTAAGPVTVDPAGMRGLLGSINAQIAGDKTGILAGPLGKMRDLITDREATAAQDQSATPAASGSPRDDLERTWAEITGQAAPAPPGAPAASGPVPLLDIESLDRARQFSRDQTASQVASGRMTPEQGAAVGQHLDQLDRLMEAASPDYVGGKANYADFSNNVLRPVEAGPVGRIAATGNPATQAGHLYPANPLPGAPAETEAAIGALSEKDPSVAAALTRQYLERAGNAAMADNRGGPNPYGPASFAAHVAGNSEQAKNLGAGLAAAAGPDARDHISNLVDVLAATGRRLPVTANDDAQAAALRAPHPINASEAGVALGVAKEAGGLAGMPAVVALHGVAKAANAYQKWQTSQAAQDLAKLLTPKAANTADAITGAQAKVSAHNWNLARALASVGSAANYNTGAQQ
ncbi:MAG TPA: hypothetical protein VHZ26_09060 [Caulobacteraceae bacterium]|nr:hypothetical protein [Caulobacteraceae bacterium]